MSLEKHYRMIFYLTFWKAWFAQTFGSLHCLIRLSVLESCSVSMNKICERIFFQITIEGINSALIHLVHNGEKIISFSYIFILIYIHIVWKGSTNNASKLHIDINVTHAHYSEKMKHEKSFCNKFIW